MVNDDEQSQYGSGEDTGEDAPHPDTPLRSVLRRSLPERADAYEQELVAKGFDTPEAVQSVDVATLLQYCPSVLPGHAALICAAMKATGNRKSPLKFDPEGTNRSEKMLEIEQRRLAGECPAFPVLLSPDSAVCRAQVQVWLESALAWLRASSADAASYVYKMMITRDEDMGDIELCNGIDKETNIYIGNGVVKAIAKNEKLMAIVPVNLRLPIPNGAAIFRSIIAKFLPKNEKYIDDLRVKFINIDPCEEKCMLEGELNAWKNLRSELARLRSEQDDMSCMASLKKLLSKIKEISGDSGIIKNSKYLLGSNISLHKLLEISEKMAVEWVSAKSIRAKNPNPSPKVPKVPPAKPPVQPEIKEVNSAKIEIKPDEKHCNRWVLSRHKCDTENCPFLHVPELENSDHPVLVARMKSGKDCRDGDACELYKQGKCPYRHTPKNSAP